MTSIWTQINLLSNMVFYYYFNEKAMLILQNYIIYGHLLSDIDTVRNYSQNKIFIELCTGENNTR